MNEIHVMPVYIADLDNTLDTLYSVRQSIKNPKRLKNIDKEIMSIDEQIRDFYSSLPTG